MNEINFQKIKTNDKLRIDLIANWYLEEWNIPKEYTFKRLSEIPNDDVIFQLVLLENEQPIATGGLYTKVGLVKKYPEYSRFGPWVALLYTIKKKRNQGFGEKLLRRIEFLSKEMNLNKIYLHTFSAEKLYLRNDYKPIKKTSYKGHITVIMEKKLSL